MSLVSLIAALALGYYRPLPGTDWLQNLFAPYADLINKNFNDSQHKHGVIAWFVAVALPVALVGGIHYGLYRINPLLSMLFAIGVLYVTLRFGQFGAKPEQIATRLRDQNIEEARSLLEEWQACDAQAYGSKEIARVSIEATLRHSHQEIFAPILWFVVLGPAGAVLYRLAHLTQASWGSKQDSFGDFAGRAFDWLDWLPARVTASTFAIVGDFEDAIYCWRTQAVTWPNQALGILLASGAGALGVRLGEPLPCKGVLEYRPELGMGDEADADYVQGAIGLIWRALALMAILLLLMTFAHWLGN